MYWTLELASKLEDAPWPATKDELIDYAIRSGEYWKICRRSRTKVMSMKVLRISGPIILQKKIFYSTKMNIKG